MRNMPLSLLLGAVFTLSCWTYTIAQTDAALLRDLTEQNKKSVEALVLYPSETRLAILDATKYPETLIKMQDMREKTSAAFRTLIEDFPRATQAVFYDVSRYPGLVGSLVSQRNNQSALHAALEVLPEGKRADAFGVVTRQMPTLAQINDLNQTTRRTFDRLISGYPLPAQRAFEHLLDLPEVIDLLNEDLRFTILVGETYRDNPAWVIQQMDSLNLAVARSHAEELQNWKTTLENDPAAEAELQSAAREYATENGFDSDNYTGDDLYYNQDFASHDDDIVVRNYYNPYPYWYGYPWWEPYPRWHPYPWWWDWGCNFYPQGAVVVYLPSYHFTHWYFDNPYHHSHYNHLSTHFVNHYNGYRRSGTTISTGVREWRERNRTVISDDFVSDPKKLPGRLKEYSRFEQERQAVNVKNPRTPVSQEAYLDKNNAKYPELQRSRAGAKVDIQRENDAIRQKRSDWAPAKAPVQPEPAPTPASPRPPRRQPIPAQKPTPSNQPVVPETAPRPQSRPDAAKDYNRQQWEEKKPQPQDMRRTNPTPASQPQRVSPQPQRAAPQQQRVTPQPQQQRAVPKPGNQKTRGN